MLIVWIPYNYFGGAGVLGNRYFMNFYGAFLFLLPPIHSVAAAFVPWVVGALFTAQIALNPFYYSWKPHEHMKHGPLRLLPVELTLVNDLPINTDVERVRVLFGTTPRFQIYFLDDNTYTKEREFFWVRGKSRADLLFKTPDPVTRLKLTLATGAVRGRRRDYRRRPAHHQALRVRERAGWWRSRSAPASRIEARAYGR